MHTMTPEEKVYLSVGSASTTRRPPLLQSTTATKLAREPEEIRSSPAPAAGGSGPINPASPFAAVLRMTGPLSSATARRSRGAASNARLCHRPSRLHHRQRALRPYVAIRPALVTRCRIRIRRQ